MLESGSSITVVSGLPRSGTSLMMQMLAAGGLPVVVDHIRTADADNPEGYFEFEAVKDLSKGDFGWVDDAQGKAVKVISALLEHLPDSCTYRIIFMRRSMVEILASQRKMLERRGELAGSIPGDRLASIYQRHLAQVEAVLDQRPNMAVLNVDYNALVVNPVLAAQHVNEFVGGYLDVSAMAQAVNQGLYRNREAHHSDSLL